MRSLYKYQSQLTTPQLNKLLTNRRLAVTQIGIFLEKFRFGEFHDDDDEDEDEEEEEDFDADTAAAAPWPSFCMC